MAVMQGSVTDWLSERRVQTTDRAKQGTYLCSEIIPLSIPGVKFLAAFSGVRQVRIVFRVSKGNLP